MFHLYVWNLSWLERIDRSLLFFFSEYLQRIRDLEDKTEIQRRQIKDLEEKVGHVLCLSVKKKKKKQCIHYR